MNLPINKEMPKQEDSKHNLPNVVAKLMGLETLPRGEPNLSVERSNRKGYSQHMYGTIGLPFKHWQQEEMYMDKEMMLHEVHPSTEPVAYKDIYETWQQSLRGKTSEDIGRWSEDVDGKKMALIHQKFAEAKRMSTDDRLRHSKQFEDALEVLSSHSDLLVRLLDSPNRFWFQASPPPDTKRITLVKPLKMVDKGKNAGKEKTKRNNKVIKKPSSVDPFENKNSGNSPEIRKVDEFPVQTTRIVLLKPSPGRTHDQKAVVSPTTSSPLNLKSGKLYHGPEYDNALEFRKVAKEITQQMHEGLRSYQNQKDKTPYPPVLYNGYSDDESSFKKSYYEYTFGNASDLGNMSPLPRLSLDYINSYGSPYSTMSLGLAPHSPESSSVSREAKRRLSERWTMMSSSKGHQEEHRHTRKNSTLGEMLSLSHLKKSVTSEIESIDYEDHEPGKSVSCTHSFNEHTSTGGSPKNLPRSNSVPASSTVYDTGLSAEGSRDVGKTNGSKMQKKSKSMRSSFKGKVASFLFSRSKKSTKEKSRTSHSKDEPQPSLAETSILPPNSPLILRDDVSQSFNADAFEECSLAALYEPSRKISTDSVSDIQEHDMITLEPELLKQMVPEISSENPAQPSPISVLQPPFEDFSNASHESLDSTKCGHQGSSPHEPLKLNLIDKSPPIESIARTLSWDDSCAEGSSPYLINPLMVSSLDSKGEEQEWLLLVHKLLSAAGLDDQQQHDSFCKRWYSLESPLDPSLRDTYVTLNDKEPQAMHEGRRRKMRSNQKLVFDFVNDALVEIVGYGSKSGLKSMINRSGSHHVQEGATTLLVDHIVAQMKELVASGMRSEWEDGGDSNSLVMVDNVVRKEVVRIGWVELVELEIDILSKEIEEELIQELVENAVADFTGKA